MHLILVGAGSAGAVIANRLSEDPNVNILLIEAGGSELESDTFRVPLKASIAQKTKYDWAYYTVPQKNSQKGMNEQVTVQFLFYFISIKTRIKSEL